MELEKIPYPLTVCKVQTLSEVDMSKEFFFVGKTDEEVSLVCVTEDAPVGAIAREDGWRGFRIRGVLDFSLIGILARVSGVLAEKEVGIFVVSTFNTDYVLVKEAEFEWALAALEEAGYVVVE